MNAEAFAQGAVVFLISITFTNIVINFMLLCFESLKECSIMDSVTMVVKLRKKYDFPVIFLSAKSEEVDKIMGLIWGRMIMSQSRLRPWSCLHVLISQLRRYNRFMTLLNSRNEAAEEAEIENRYTAGGLELNEDTATVLVDGGPVKMMPIELRILALLIRSPGRVFSAAEIYERVWNERAINTDTIMVHVRNIREKIEINPKNPKYLKVVWGVGYKIEKQ